MKSIEVQEFGGREVHRRSIGMRGDAIRQPVQTRALRGIGAAYAVV